MKICIVAILKEEIRFVDEWILYHRMLGVDHFFLYDDDVVPLLKDYLSFHYSSYVTVVDWHKDKLEVEGYSSQACAYTHALQHFLMPYEWVAFIDGDEFIVLPAWNDNIYSFLVEFDNVVAVSLNWHVFGHNGYYDDPPGLITSSLTRRMLAPNPNVKSITRTSHISKITSPHSCHTKAHPRVDANHRLFNRTLYEGKTSRGFINHYQCRSFKRWMNRVERGDASRINGQYREEQQWRYDQELCLKQFVTTVAYNKNEFIDEYMLKFEPSLKDAMSLNKQIKGSYSQLK